MSIRSLSATTPTHQDAPQANTSASGSMYGQSLHGDLWDRLAGSPTPRATTPSEVPSLHLERSDSVVGDVDMDIDLSDLSLGNGTDVLDSVVHLNELPPEFCYAYFERDSGRRPVRCPNGQVVPNCNPVVPRAVMADEIAWQPVLANDGRTGHKFLLLCRGVVQAHVEAFPVGANDLRLVVVHGLYSSFAHVAKLVDRHSILEFHTVGAHIRRLYTTIESSINEDTMYLPVNELVIGSQLSPTSSSALPVTIPDSLSSHPVRTVHSNHAFLYISSPFHTLLLLSVCTHTTCKSSGYGGFIPASLGTTASNNSSGTSLGHWWNYLGKLCTWECEVDTNLQMEYIIANSHRLRRTEWIEGVGLRVSNNSNNNYEANVSSAVASDELVVVASDQNDDGVGNEDTVADTEVNDDPVPNPRRYFNQQLRGVYERVQFPVRQPFTATPAAVPSTQYTRTLHRNGTKKNGSKQTPVVRWCHSMRTPVHPPPDPLYGNRFRALLNMPSGDRGGGGDNNDDANGSGGGAPSNKRQKKANDNNNHEASGSKDTKPPKGRKQQPPKPTPKAAPKAPVTNKPTDKPVSEKKATFKRKNAVQGVLRTYKIRMWPNEAQAKELKRVFAASRYVKNWCNAELKQRRNVPDERSPGTFKQLYPTRIGIRNQFKAKGRHQLPSWACENVSSTVFDNACFDVSKAWTNGIEAVKAGRITHFDVKFWSSTFKTPTEVLKVDKKARPDGKQASSIFDTTTRHTPSKRRSGKHSECLLHLNKGFAKLGGIRMQDKTPIIERLLSEGRMLKEDCKIKWDKRTRSFHFVYTVDVPVADEPNPDWSTKRVTAFDGGIRGFQTFCNATTGQYGELVCGFDRRIHDRVERIDDLHSRCIRKQQGQGVRTSNKQRKPRAQRRHDRINARERRRRQGACCPARKPAKDKRLTCLNRKLRRERVRHTNWVEAVHYNAINFVFDTTDVVINPVLRTGSMAPRNGRVFGSDSCRAMLSMSHYKFNWRLKSAASRFPGRHVIDDTGEPGTSRTCANPNCGRWHTNLGGAHVFTCPHCGVSLNRDDNGARGNLLAAYGKAVGVLADATSNQ